MSLFLNDLPNCEAVLTAAVMSKRGARSDRHVALYHLAQKSHRTPEKAVKRPMEIERRIRNFILENYLFTSDDGVLQTDQSLVQTGVLDSTGMLELVSFLHEAFKVEVYDDEMIPENLDSVDRLSTFVKSKLAVTA